MLDPSQNSPSDSPPPFQGDASTALEWSLAWPGQSSTLFNAAHSDFRLATRKASQAAGMQLISVDFDSIPGSCGLYTSPQMDELDHRRFNSGGSMADAVKLAMATSASPALLAVTGNHHANRESVHALIELAQFSARHGIHLVIDAPDVDKIDPALAARSNALAKQSPAGRPTPTAFANKLAERRAAQAKGAEAPAHSTPPTAARS